MDSAAAPDVAAAAPVDPAAAPARDPLSGVLSAREAATALGISERTVRRAIQRGELSATKRSGSFHITPDALEAYRCRETGHAGQRVLSHAATPDTTGAAAPDQRADNGAVHAAAADTGQGATEAIRVLRELLAEERQKSDRLLEASTIWQTRALQLEQRLKELEAGPIAQDADDHTRGDAPVAYESGPARGDVAVGVSEPLIDRLRRFLRR
jgi:excisionase family DNA binding protein